MHMRVSLARKGPILDQLHLCSRCQKEPCRIGYSTLQAVVRTLICLSPVPNLSPGLSALTPAQAAQTSQVSPASANEGVHGEGEGREGSKDRLLPQSGRML